MHCREWKDQWVAGLYGELEPAERAELEDHVSRCTQCRETLAELSGTSRLLKEAMPDAPAAPRVIVLRPRGLARPLWAFAAGAACALVLFSLGVASGGLLMPGPPAPVAIDPTAAAEKPSPELVAVRQLEQRLDELEGQALARRSAEPSDRLTQAQLDRELSRFRRQLDRERVRDLDYLIQAITDTELRTGTRIDETRTALQLLALTQDPRVAER